MRARLDHEIAPPPRRPQISTRRRGASPIADRILAAAETFLARAVVVRIARKAGGRSGFDPGFEQRVARLGILGAERPCAAAPGILTALPGLAAAEIGQHLRIGPAAGALLRPAVIIG